jgi:tRNA (cmo5U34)-methyltransferase
MLYGLMKDAAARYDEHLKGTVPFWEPYYNRILAYLPPGEPTILELGCGSGFLTTLISDARPKSAITCIDQSLAMLAIARQKPGLESVRFIEGDIREKWPGTPYDAVVSSFCLFGLPVGDRTPIIARAYRALNTGGVLITGDLFRPPTSGEIPLYRDHRRRWMEEHRLDPGEVQWQLDALDAVTDRLDTVARFLKRLEFVGFPRFFCPYSHEMEGIIVGVR